jgi:glycosyltransferase involved in cell wall biosynthesis
MTPAISIIVPVYNSTKYLDTCLDSLSSQKLEDIEIICIDDGSDDGSAAILQAHAAKDARIRVFSQDNAGTGAARNTGLQHARGEFIMFCDNDDYYSPDTCQKMYEAMRKSSADLVKCYFASIQNGRLFDERKTQGQLEEGVVHPLNQEWKGYLGRGIWDKIFRKSIVDRQGIWFPQTRCAEDTAFLLQYMAVASTCLVIPDTLYFYKIRNDSVSGKHENNVMNLQSDVIASFQFVLRFLDDRSHRDDSSRDGGHRLDGKNLVKENSVLLFHFVHDIQIFCKAAENKTSQCFRKIKNDILTFYDAEDIARYPILAAINEEDDEKARELLVDAEILAHLGLVLQPGMLVTREK